MQTLVAVDHAAKCGRSGERYRRMRMDMPMVRGYAAQRVWGPGSTSGGRERGIAAALTNSTHG